MTARSEGDRRRRREYHQRNRRHLRLRWKYGISEVDYQRMFTQQKGVCAICARPSLKGVLDVDHDHATGRVRGLLCNPCNRGLGSFQDDPIRLAEAVRYLERYV